MSLALIPQPKKLALRPGVFRLPPQGAIAVASREFFDVACEVQGLLPGHEIAVVARGMRDTLHIAHRAGLKPGGYRLAIGPDGIALEAGDPAAARNGLQTLFQIARQSPAGVLPRLAIDDWPDFADRGVYYDVCRGRVPTLETLLAQAELLSHYKINHLQYYIEHTYRFRKHPLIGKGCDPLTAEDLMTLDSFCAGRGIELVPSLAAFGHMANILTLVPYRHLAEDLGVGKYRDTDSIPVWARHLKGWTLSPANPEIYDFLDELFAEFLPCFSSKTFNVCCDETWDLGCGESHDLCQRKGRGEVYLGHIIRLNQLCRKHGKRMMFWGDIIRHYPKLISRIPRDVTVLDWGYDFDHPFARIKDFTRTGLKTYVCPGTSSWVSLFPRLPEAMTNIHGFATAGKKCGAQGLLNTDWGDHGHYNFMEFSWHGYLFGAEQAWNTDADRKSFNERFCRQFLNCTRPDMATAVRELGDVTELKVDGWYQSIWQHLLFAAPKDAIFAKGRAKAWASRNGEVRETKVSLDAALGRATIQRLAKARAVFARCLREKGADPHGVLPYWIFACDTIACAARKLAAFGPGGRDSAALRAGLRKELKALEKRFHRLWMARNRRSEIRMTLKRYRKAIRDLAR